MATIDLDALELKTPDRTRTADVVRLKVGTKPTGRKTRSLGFTRGDPKNIPLTEADIIVDGGRGLGSHDGFRLVEELAQVLGASVGATRIAVEEGWAARDRQIGQTGKTVKPKLLIACGVSGATQHAMGMRQAKTVVAVNCDRAAPIFKSADVAVVGDVLQLLPVLIAQLREALTGNPGSGMNEVLDAFRDQESELGGLQ
jgi:electron transfer flavoprotein alpha subunit